MDIGSATALVTGANRGLGGALRRSWSRAVRPSTPRPDSRSQVDLPGVKAIRLDITDPASVAAAAEQARDVTVLVNNAGTSTGADLLTGSWDAVRLETETHYLGTLRMIRAFAPVIKAGAAGRSSTSCPSCRGEDAAAQRRYPASVCVPSTVSSARRSASSVPGSAV